MTFPRILDNRLQKNIEYFWQSFISVFTKSLFIFPMQKYIENGLKIRLESKLHEINAEWWLF